MKNQGIYIIKFKGCKRVYIGQSINLKNRWKYHRVELKANRHYNPKLQSAYNKYGHENMTIEVLEFSDDNLDSLERFYIEKFNSFHQGLNCSSGGFQPITKSTKIVYQYSKDGELINTHQGFASASRYLDIGESNIRQVCYGKMNTAKGFHFSLRPKTKGEVIIDVTPKYFSVDFKKKHSERMSGSKNPMFGKFRPEIKGVLNPYYIKIKNGFAPKRRIDVQRVIQLYKTNTQKEIAEQLECAQGRISEILRENGIRKFSRKKADMYFTV